MERDPQESGTDGGLVPDPLPHASGKKLFTDGSAPHTYKLTRSRVSSLVIAHYERSGQIKIGDTALAEPSKAEAARQERMKREG